MSETHCKCGEEISGETKSCARCRFEVAPYAESEATIPPDILRPLHVDDARGFLARLVSSLRGKASVKRDGNFSAQLTGGASFASGERLINPEDVWREVNRPFVVAGVVVCVLAVLAIGLAFFFAGVHGRPRIELTQPVAEIPEDYR